MEHIFMPNEIFEDFNNSIETSAHRAFAYSYVYYTTYLYRYCKYNADEKNTQSEIKQRLGYSPIQKKVDYLIKKDGVLDGLGYTMTTTNYPVSWSINEHDLLIFKTIDDVKNESVLPIITEKNFKVKYPLRAFHRTDESEKEQVLDGIFFDVSNTHRINHDKFILMMEEPKELGTVAFYIYGYVRYKNDKFGAYQASFENLASELGLSKTTLAKYIKAMEYHGLLHVKHEKFNKGKSGEANMYTAI